MAIFDGFILLIPIICLIIYFFKYKFKKIRLLTLLSLISLSIAFIFMLTFWVLEYLILNPERLFKNEDYSYRLIHEQKVYNSFIRVYKLEDALSRNAIEVRSEIEILPGMYFTRILGYQYEASDAIINVTNLNDIHFIH